MLNNKCIYFHINPLKNHIFYVGIGDENRPYDKRNRNRHWHFVVNKYGYIIDVVEKNLTWEEACKKERFYINKIGRKDLKKGNLVNVTDGGEGNLGLIHTSTAKEKMSIARKGIKHTDEHNKNVSQSLKGRVFSKEHRENISRARKGKNRKPHTEEHRRKIGDSKRGKKRVFSPEWRNNLGNATRGKKRPPFSQEWKDNMRKSKLLNKRIGWHHSEETKRKISEGNLKRLQKNKIQLNLF